MDSIENYSRTSSVINIVGPISKLIKDFKQVSRSLDCNAKVMVNLLTSCEKLEFSSRQMFECIMKEANLLEDEKFIEEIKELDPLFIHSIIEFSDSTSDLFQGEGIEVRDTNKVWNQVIAYAEDIVQNLIKVLLAWDHAHLRRINKSFEDFLKALNVLKKAPFNHLTNTFRVLVDEAMDMFELVQGRSQNICCPAQSESLLLSSRQLYKTLSILAAVMIPSEHLHNETAKICQNLITTEIETLILCLRRDSGLGLSKYDLQESGKYASAMDVLFDVFTLKPGQKAVEKLPLVNKIKALLEVVLHHSIGVAQSGTPEDYSSMVVVCENVVHQMKALSEIETAKNINSENIDSFFAVIINMLESFEKKVNFTLASSIIQVFTNPYSTLDRLTNLMKLNYEKVNNLGSEDIVELKKALEIEMDNIRRLGGCIIASNTDASESRDIGSSLALLSWLGSCIMAHIATQPYHLIQLLVEQWKIVMEKLRKSIYSLCEVDPMVQIAKKEIHIIWAEMRDRISFCHDTIWFKKKVRYATCLVQLLLSMNENHDYLDYKRKMELRGILPELEKYEGQVIETNFSGKATSSFVKRLQILLTCISRICYSVSEKGRILSQSEYELLGFTFSDDPYKTDRMINNRSRPELISSTKDFQKKLSNPHEGGTPIMHTQGYPSDGGTLFCDTNGLAKDESRPDQLSISPIINQSSREMKNCEIESPSFHSVGKAKPLQVVRGSDSVITDCPKELDLAMSEDDICEYSNGAWNHCLSTSSNTFRNSTINSQPNFCQEVNEINMDISDISTITPTEKAPKSSFSVHDNSSSIFEETLQRIKDFTKSFRSSSHTENGHSSNWRKFYKGRDNLNLNIGRDTHNCQENETNSVPLEQSLEDLKDCNGKEETENNVEMKDLSNSNIAPEPCDDASSSDLSPSGTSTNIDTPQRLEDIRTIRQRLEDLETKFAETNLCEK